MDRDTILCATDLTESGARALELSAKLAAAVGAHVELVHVAEPGRGADRLDWFAGDRPARTQLHDRVRTHIQELAAALEEHRRRCLAYDVPCEGTLEEGRPWEIIVELATRQQPLLVVVGPHDGRDGSPAASSRFRDRARGTTANRIVRYSPCSVLVCNNTHVPESFRGARWLVGLDFSAPSEQALSEAALLAKASAGELLVAHVVPAPGPGNGTGAPAGYGKQIEAWKRDASDKLHVYASTAVHGVPVGGEHLGYGDPADELCEAARAHRAQVLVLGTHGRTGVLRALLGSTAERALRRADVPVLVVRRAEVGR